MNNLDCTSLDLAAKSILTANDLEVSLPLLLPQVTFLNDSVIFLYSFSTNKKKSFLYNNGLQVLAIHFVVCVGFFIIILFIFLF